MAIHYSNFGNFGGELQGLADVQGFVPKLGDEQIEFGYPHGYAADSWLEHVADCIAALERAERALDTWRKENV